MPSDGTIENGMDFVKIYKMVSKYSPKIRLKKSDLNPIDFFRNGWKRN
jgi:hypothetical protein